MLPRATDMSSKARPSTRHVRSPLAVRRQASNATKPRSARNPLKARKEVLLLKRIFDEFDRDRDGRVSQSELASALKRFRDQTRPRGQSYKSPAEQSAEGIALLAFQVMDSDQDGAVSFDELLRLCLPEASEQDVQRCLALVAPRKSNGPPEVPEVAGAEISALFGIYDTDRSNSICVAELEAAGACGLDQRELQNLVKSTTWTATVS